MWPGSRSGVRGRSGGCDYLEEMRFIKPLWLNHSGDKKDFGVYSCHVSPDSERLVTAAGGKAASVGTTFRLADFTSLQMVT